MTEAIRQVADGRSGVLLIEGAAGIGKTRLLDEVLWEDGEGVHFATATAMASDGPRPFAPLLDALDLPTLQAPPEVVDSRLWAVDRLRGAIEDLAVSGPVVVAVDDLHLADPATLVALQRLPPQLVSYPLLWILLGRTEGSRRSEPLRRLVRSLESSAGIRRLGLGPLDRTAVIAMVSDIGGGPPDGELLGVIDGARGNPLLVRELVESFTRQGLAEASTGRLRLLAAQLPQDLSSIVAGRLSTISASGRELLEVAAVLGGRFAADDLTDALGKPLGHVLATVHELIDAEILHPVGGELQFAHNLVADVVYEGLPEPLREALHRQVGRLLSERGGSIHRAAGHLLRGARIGDRTVLAALDRVVEEVQVASPETAVDLAVRAVELTEADDGELVGRRRRAIDALVACGRLSEAMDLTRSVLATPTSLSPGAAAGLRLCLSSILFLSGRTEESGVEAEAVMREDGLPEEVYAAAELAHLLALMATDDWERARGPAQAILAGGDRAGADGALAGALTALGFVAWDEGRMADGLGLLQAAVQRADQGPPAARRNHPRLGLANMLLAVGDLDQARDVLDRSRGEIELLGDHSWMAAHLVGLARVDIVAGNLDDAEAGAQVALAEAEAHGARFFVPMALSTLSVIALMRGDLERAARSIEGALELLPNGQEGALGSAVYALAAAVVTEARRGPEPAMARLSPVLDEPARHRRLLVEGQGTGAWMVRLALSVGDEQRAATLVRELEDLADRNADFSSMRAEANHAGGLLRRDAIALTAAVEAARPPWPHASALEDLGRLVAKSDPSLGRQHLECSEALYRKGGASRDADRLRHRLACEGVLAASEPRPSSSPPTVSELTDSERRVAKLVADGLTNREVAGKLYLSRHTVDFHLRQIFRRLSINSRVELTRLVVEQRTR